MPHFIVTTDIKCPDGIWYDLKRGDRIWIREQLVFDLAAQCGHPKLCVMPEELEKVITEKIREYDKKRKELNEHETLEIRELCLTFLREVER